MSNSSKVPLKFRRLIKEIDDLNKIKDEKNNENRISCKTVNPDEFSLLDVNLFGPPDSPFEGGLFNLRVSIKDNYPFQPANFKFTTPIYHPNIDNNGNICLDLLKLPPNGTYNPTLRLDTIVLSIQLLLATPNPEDPLMLKIAEQYKLNRKEYELTAREMTQKYATAIK